MRPFLSAVILCLAASTLAPAQPPKDQRRPAGPPAFEVLDRDRDGKLSRDELPPGARDLFDRIDANKDGSISRAEDDAFRRRMTAGPGPNSAPRVPESVKVEKDIAYAGTKNPRQALDLYLPRRPRGDRPLPVVVVIHGGAWKGGEKAMTGGGAAGFAASGEYAGVAINYRLSSEAIWPAQIHDCKAAVRWVRANAAKYHLDPDRIGVMGGSAGGHLVAMLGVASTEPALEGDLGPHKGVSSQVRCVVDEFGPSDLLTMGDYPSSMDHNAANSPESELVGGPVQKNKEKARSASPVTYVSKDDPPFLIIHGTDDPLVPFNQSERLAKALKAAGVETFLIAVKKGGHGGFRNPELSRRTRQFLDKHLLGRGSGPISEEAVENAANIPAARATARPSTR